MNDQQLTEVTGEYPLSANTFFIDGNNFHWQVTVRGRTPDEFALRIEGVKRIIQEKLAGVPKPVGAQNFDTPKPVPQAGAQQSAPAPQASQPPAQPQQVAPAGVVVDAKGNWPGKRDSFRVTRLDVSPRPDTKIDLKFFGAGDQYPRISATWPEEKAYAMIAPVTDAGLDRMASFPVNFSLDWVASSKTNTKGNYYQDIEALRNA